MNKYKEKNAVVKLQKKYEEDCFYTSRIQIESDYKGYSRYLFWCSYQ